MSLDRIIDEINRRVDDASALSLLYLYSSACRACDPTAAQAVRELTQLDSLAVNVDAIPEIWTAFELGAVPTWLLVGQGQAIAEWPGVLEVSSVAGRIIEVVQQFYRRGEPA